MLWDRCCENGSVMSPVFKWSSALPSDDKPGAPLSPRAAGITATSTVTAELYRCETHLNQDFFLRGCHRLQQSPLTLVQFKIGTVEHLATKKCYFTIWRAWSELYGNSDPCAHNQYKCANYSLTFELFTYFYFSLTRLLLGRRFLFAFLFAILYCYFFPAIGYFHFNDVFSYVA